MCFFLILFLIWFTCIYTLKFKPPEDLFVTWFQAAGLFVCKYSLTVKPHFESNLFPCLQIPINVLNIWLMTASVQENMHSLTPTHTLPFNLALFNMPLRLRFANLGLCNCRRPADPLRADMLWGGMRLRLWVWISIRRCSVPRDFSPSCVCRAISESGGENCWFIFFSVTDKNGVSCFEGAGLWAHVRGRGRN